MSTTITCVYTAIATGALTGAQLATRMAAAAVPVDSQLLTDYGLSVTSDTTSNVATTVTRTIVLSMVPTVAATATAALGGGPSGTGISAVTVTGAGAGYVGVPIVAPAAQANIIRGAQMHAVMSGGTVASIVVDDPGQGYSTAPAIGITPLFKSLFPDGTDQVSPLANFMTEVIQASALTPVVASTPVVT
jgi:hypothetical protein